MNIKSYLLRIRRAATTLLPYGQYNADIAAAARQAGIEMIIGNKANDSNSYSLVEYLHLRISTFSGQI